MLNRVAENLKQSNTPIDIIIESDISKVLIGKMGYL